MRVLVRSLGELLITVGGLTLMFLVWQLFWTDVVADRQQQRTTDALVEAWDAQETPADVRDGEDPAARSAASQDPDPILAALPSDAVAVLRVPGFGDDYAVPVLEGTTSDILKSGIGHYVDTAGPGEVGNFALAGHRTTYGAPFNSIAELADGDPVVVETAEAYFVYRVVSTRVVDPSEVSVIAPVPGRPGELPDEAYLTMTSCHPMFSARQRYIVHAVFETTTEREDGAPTALTP